MARIRSVHPGLFTDEAFAALSMGARVLLIGLWTEADDQGVFEWNALKLKMRVFPADAVDVAALLLELDSAGVIRQFSSGGRTYAAIRNFRKYQRPKSPKHVHPLPSDLVSFVGLAASTSESNEDEVIPFPQNGEIEPQREEEGCRRKDVKKLDEAGARPISNLPSFFEPSQRVIEALGGDLEDHRWFSQRPRVGEWLKKWDLELDILPACRRLSASRASKNKTPIFSFEFCEGAIADAHASRTAPLPQGRVTQADDKQSSVRSAIERRIAGLGGTREICARANDDPSGVILEGEAP